MTTLRARLALICGLLSIALVVVGVTGFVSLKSVSGTYQHVVDINLPNALILQQMSLATGNSIRQMIRLGYTNLSEKEINYLAGRFEEYVSKYNEQDVKYQSVPFVDGESELYNKVAADWKKTVEVAHQLIALRAKGNLSEFHTLLDGDFRNYYNSHGKALDQLIAFQETESRVWSDKAVGMMENARQILVVISLVGLLIGLGVAVLISSQLQKTLRAIAEAVAASKSDVENASQQLSLASQQLANSSTEAAASLEETVASIEELTSMVKLNSANAVQASQMAQSSQEFAVNGNREMEGLISSMGDINKSSQKIEEIINVIDDIAFQTNLLALNAAVEAARAGEQGKGFSVVAEAVRALAQRSAQAAKEISTLIKESVSEVDKGTEIADRSGLALKEIVSSVTKVSQLNSEIASASSEQSEGIAQISKAMNQLDQATQANAASAEEAAASSEVMVRQAQILGEQVYQLQKIVA